MPYTENVMKIGIIGAGGIAQAIAKQALGAGYEVILSNSRGPETLKAMVQGFGAGASAGSVREAAQADLVVLAVQWSNVAKALAGLPDWNGRILIDATNPTTGPPDFKLADLGGKTSSQVVVSLAPGARVVKALNTLIVANLSANPREAGGRRVLFMSGDDAAAKKEVTKVLDRIGFATIDLGSLSIGGALQQFPGGPLPVHNLIKLV
jgi:8-hydroxy-5-deazaflavin:NADPH oxidoreductase